ncbi:MAG TPA: RIP metalloprotease RseP [Acidobacteriaceae bacterium]|jgi:regulator of sigma E protease|nr:RIP metalloprotease RseP [Acidobacteriaceae bacterium]
MSFAFLSIVSVLIVLGIMVLVHEFGHFVVAKMCGVRVEVFSVGFGKRLFGFHHGDTDYRLSLLPLGGYVKMSGEMMPDTSKSEQTSDPGDYNNHPRWQRILISCAGPAANFVLAFLLLTVVYMAHNEVPNFMNGPAIVDYVQPDSVAAKAGLVRNDQIVRYDGVQNPEWQQVYIHTILNLNHDVSLSVERQGQIQNLQMHLPSVSDPDNFSFQDLGIAAHEQNTPLQVVAVETTFPGYKAGLREGDEISAIDGIAFRSMTSLILYLQQEAGKPVALTVLRHGKPLALNVKPAVHQNVAGQSVYQIGFSTNPPPSHVERLPLFAAMQQSVRENVKDSTLVLEIVHRMVTLQMSVRSLSGPVGIARETGHIVSMPGWTPLFGEMATISLQLGIFNLLPIPILDGGTILMLLIESLLRHDLNQQFKERIYQTAFVFLILFMAFVLFNDLTKLPIFAHFHSFD